METHRQLKRKIARIERQLNKFEERLVEMEADELNWPDIPGCFELPPVTSCANACPALMPCSNICGKACCRLSGIENCLAANPGKKNGKP